MHYNLVAASAVCFCSTFTLFNLFHFGFSFFSSRLLSLLIILGCVISWQTCGLSHTFNRKHIKNLFISYVVLTYCSLFDFLFLCTLQVGKNQVYKHLLLQVTLPLLLPGAHYSRVSFARRLIMTTFIISNLITPCLRVFGSAYLKHPNPLWLPW